MTAVAMMFQGEFAGRGERLPALRLLALPAVPAVLADDADAEHQLANVISED